MGCKGKRGGDTSRVAWGHSQNSKDINKGYNGD